MKAIGPVLVIVVGALSAILLTYFVCDIATDASAGIAVPTTSVTSLRASASIFDTTEQHFDPSDDAPPATFGARDLTVGAGGSVEGEVPIETYYLPLKEHDIYNAMRTIQKEGVFDDKPRIVSITSISIAADDTIIWYDHHEDGYESDITNLANLQSSTEIWGDGDCSNGSPPNVGTCQDVDDDDDDYLTAGMAINIINDVPVPYNSSVWGSLEKYKYDGGDKLDSTFPVAITRGGYPYDGPNDADTNPLFAGAVEVLNTENYGTEFISPIGTDTERSNNAFQQTELHIMARTGGTVVTLTADNTNRTYPEIVAGQSLRITGIKEGDIITTAAGYPVQAHLITGDIGKGREAKYLWCMSW